jgi:hypothetical protein
MENLSALKRQLSELTVVTKEQLLYFENEIMADGVVTEGEAQFMYEACYDVIRKAESQECIDIWKNIFVNVMTSFVIDDERSKGEIDEAEAAWVERKVNYDITMLDIEKALLKNLAEKSKNFPEKLKSLI